VTDLTTEAFAMLDKRGAVMETARLVSRVLREHKIRGGVIGGVAVVLHGYRRTTDDVDVLVQQRLDDLKAPLRAEGVEFDAAEREFRHQGVPVHLVDETLAKFAPKEFRDIDGVQTVGLADLISMKLHSGTSEMLRAQDLADVIGLIRKHNLTATFAAQIDRPMRTEFRKLVKAIQHEKEKS
jgi:hypothetical protein